MFDSVFWAKGDSLDEYVERLRTFNGTTLDVHIDQRFVNACAALNKVSSRRLMTALRESAITSVSLNEEGVVFPTTRRKTGHIRNLCRALGSNPATTTLALPVLAHDLDLSSALIDSMTQITKLQLFDLVRHREEEEEEEAAEEIATIRPEFLVSLGHHASVVDIEVAVSPRFYAEMIPVIATFPRLANACFDGVYWASESEIPLSWAQSIGQLLMSAPSLSDVTLKRLPLLEDEIIHSIFNSIRESNVRCLEMHECYLSALEQLAPALSIPHLQKLVLDRNMFDSSDDESVFWTTLGSGMTAFQDMETCQCGFTKKFGPDTPERQEALATFLRRVSACPRLQTIDLAVNSFTANLDQALALCVNMCPLLSTIHVNFSEFAPIAREGYASPALLEATMTHCNVQVTFKTTRSMSPVDAVSADPDTNTQFRMINRLNAAGRNYLVSDAGNKLRGVGVLDSVLDSLDCLYFHVRENPSLCEMGEAEDAAGHW